MIKDAHFPNFGAQADASMAPKVFKQLCAHIARTLTQTQLSCTDQHTHTHTHTCTHAHTHTRTRAHAHAHMQHMRQVTTIHQKQLRPWQGGCKIPKTHIHARTHIRMKVTHVYFHHCSSETVTLLARLRGWSTSKPFRMAKW